MENTNIELLNDALVDGFDNLNGLTGKEYTEGVNAVVDLYKLKLEEDKLQEQRYKADQEAEAERIRLEIEELQRKAEMKKELIKAGADLGKAGLTVGGTALFLKWIMKFEETGVITTKAFGFLPKLLKL